MPGTFGSLAAAIMFYLLWLAFGEAARWIVLALLLIVGAVAIALGRWAEDHFKSADPRQFVLDEVVGQWLTLLFVPPGDSPRTRCRPSRRRSSCSAPSTWPSRSRSAASSGCRPAGESSSTTWLRRSTRASGSGS